jgi:hypothetical protein
MVISTSRAKSTAKDEAAEIPMTMGIPATIAFFTTSQLTRPLTTSIVCVAGMCPFASNLPTTLSTALCRPTSSKLESRSPSNVDSPGFH